MLGRLTSLRSLRGGLIATPAPLPASVLRAAAPARYMGSVFNSSRPIVILRSDQPAARAVMSQVLRRGLSTAANSAPKTDAAAGSAAETAEAKAEGKAEEAKQNEEAAEEEVYEDVPMEDEPLAAKWSRRELLPPAELLVATSTRVCALFIYLVTCHPFYSCVQAFGRPSRSA